MSEVVYSVVVPLFNEQEVLPETCRRLKSVMDSLRESYEIVMVNDGSRDNTAAMAKEICRGDAAFKLISFSRNFGHQTAITAGMDHACGKAVVVIDADLQDPPELIATLIEKWREGAEIVLARRIDRHSDSWLKRNTATWFYRAHNAFSEVRIPPNVGDFRLMDRVAIDALKP